MAMKSLDKAKVKERKTIMEKYSRNLRDPQLQGVEMKFKWDYILYARSPNRQFDLSCPFEQHFRIAESQVLRMNVLGTVNKDKCITKIEYCENPKLIEKFNEKKKYFASRNISKSELLLFHGTNPKNIDSILKNNFDKSRMGKNGSAFGRGISGEFG